MQDLLISAYCKFFGKKAVGLSQWQILDELVTHLDPRRLGMGLSRYILYVACCTRVDYPDECVKKRIVEAARQKASEVFEEHPDSEISVGDIERLYRAHEEEFKADISAHLCASLV